jgi:hypothetical protein
MTRRRVDHERGGDPAWGVLHDAGGPLGPGPRAMTRPGLLPQRLAIPGTAGVACERRRR